MKKRKLPAKTPFASVTSIFFIRAIPIAHLQRAFRVSMTRESKSHIFKHSILKLYYFRLWHLWPKRYRYYRFATRSELKDYVYNMGRSNGEK